MTRLDQVTTFLTTEPNWIQSLSDKTIGWLKDHPKIYKVALTINHWIRAACMFTLMASLPYSPLVNFSIGLSMSLFYRLTIEKKCIFHFALASTFGAEVFRFSKPALVQIVNGLAKGALTISGRNFVMVIPFVFYGICLTKLVNRNVDEGGCRI